MTWKEFKDAWKVDWRSETGTWGMIGAATIATAGGVYASSKGGGSTMSGVQIPEYWKDEYYEKAQEPLYNVSKGLLEGKPSEYYAPIGQYGGQELENVLGLLTKDVTRGVNEDLVRRGVGRGGIGTTAISKAVGDVSGQMRWSDYMRALQGRQNLLNTGMTGMTGVRSGALSEEQIRNQFSLGASGLEMQKAAGVDQYNAQQGETWSNLIGSGIGAAANIYGMNMLGNIGGSSLGRSGASRIATPGTIGSYSGYRY